MAAEPPEQAPPQPPAAASWDAKSEARIETVLTPVIAALLARALVKTRGRNARKGTRYDTNPRDPAVASGTRLDIDAAGLDPEAWATAIIAALTPTVTAVVIGALALQAANVGVMVGPHDGQALIGSTTADLHTDTVDKITRLRTALIAADASGQSVDNLATIITASVNPKTWAEIVAIGIVTSVLAAALIAVLSKAKTQAQQPPSASDSATVTALRGGGNAATMWRTMRDDHVRPEHAAVDGDIKAIGHPFIVGGYPMMFPGDQSAPIGLWIRCRCRLVPSLFGDGTKADPVFVAEVKAALGAALAGDALSRFDDVHVRAQHGRFGSKPGQAHIAKIKTPRVIKARAAADAAIKPVKTPRPQVHVEPTAAPPGMRAMTADERVTLKVPPALRNVFISHDPDAALVYRGVDGQGRAVRVYSAAHNEAAAAAKFRRMADLQHHLSSLDAKLTTDAMGNDTALAVLLMRNLGLRPGSERDTKALKKAHGATNLRARHVSVNGDVVSLRFVGKKGVNISLDTKDPLLAAAISKRLDGKQPDDPLLGTNETKALAYIKANTGPGFKSKDLRTAHANRIALSVVESLGTPKTPAESAAARKAVATVVSQALGNTPAVAQTAYIDQTVYQGWPPAPPGKVRKVKE